MSFLHQPIEIWSMHQIWQLQWERIFSEMDPSSSHRKMELPWSWWYNWSPGIEGKDRYSVWLSWLEWPFSSVLLWISTLKVLKDFVCQFEWHHLGQWHHLELSRARESMRQTSITLVSVLCLLMAYNGAGTSAGASLCPGGISKCLRACKHECS